MGSVDPGGGSQRFSSAWLLRRDLFYPQYREAAKGFLLSIEFFSSDTLRLPDRCLCYRFTSLCGVLIGKHCCHVDQCGVRYNLLPCVVGWTGPVTSSSPSDAIWHLQIFKHFFILHAFFPSPQGLTCIFVEPLFPDPLSLAQVLFSLRPPALCLR